MQRGFLESGAALEVPPGRELIPCISRLVDCCRQVHVPVIFTEFVYSPAVPCLTGDRAQFVKADYSTKSGYVRPGTRHDPGPQFSHFSRLILSWSTMIILIVGSYWGVLI
ncbi:MAG: isochorismatase family protein [Phycisphaerae bacterium]|nr:isochorismatase family protein [Phycisphaerae bacterium]